MNTNTINFESKTEIMDDVILNWHINSPLNEYRLTMQFSGAIDENGNIDIYNSSFCEISINEIESHKPYILETIKELIENTLNITLSTYDESILLYSPDIRSSIYYRDEDSLESSISIANEFVKQLCKVTSIESEEIELSIDSYLYAVA